LLNPKIPFGFTLGNHDASPNFMKEGALAQQFWTVKISQTGLTFIDSSHYPFYFSYLKQNVFLMSWDAAGAKIMPEVFDWMKAQLSSDLAIEFGLIGDGPRPILVHAASAKKSFTMIDIPVSSPKRFKYTTWVATEDTILKMSNLPDPVVGFNGMVKRRDKSY
jgi:hypothetical protein